LYYESMDDSDCQDHQKDSHSHSWILNLFHSNTSNGKFQIIYLFL
jgi:hypothetical protein